MNLWKKFKSNSSTITQNAINFNKLLTLLVESDDFNNLKEFIKLAPFYNKSGKRNLSPDVLIAAVFFSNCECSLRYLLCNHVFNNNKFSINNFRELISNYGAINYSTLDVNELVEHLRKEEK